MEKKYWQSFGELNQSEAFQKKAENEFQEQLLPMEDLDKGLLDAKSPRRDFLKYLVLALLLPRWLPVAKRRYAKRFHS